MTTYPAWTPASRPGIIPLHPLSFGTILGRSFTALRQNPKVLLGFALCVQAVAYLVVLVARGRRGLGLVLAPGHPRAGQRGLQRRDGGLDRPDRDRGHRAGPRRGGTGRHRPGRRGGRGRARRPRREADPRRALAPREARRLAPARLLVPARARDAGPARGGRRRHLRDRVGRAARRDRALPAARARRGAPHAVADRQAAARALRDHPRTRDDRRRDRTIVATHPRPVLADARHRRRRLADLRRDRAGRRSAVPADHHGADDDHRADRRSWTDRRHRPDRVAPAGAGRHAADPVGRLRRPVHLDGAHLPRLPHAPRRARPRPALVRGATGCRGHRPPGSLP